MRAFVGLEAARPPGERAQIAVAELRSAGRLRPQGAIAVAGTTGSGWIDPKAADSLDYATHGDVAIVSTQYSYLPSWLSFLVDRSRAASNAETLITALRVELDGLPADQRPELYVFGESLGAFSTDSAFTSVEDMSTTTDGALLIGPPSFDPTWQKVVAGRKPGSPVWRPLYGDGGLVRVATTAGDLTDQTLTWTTDNPIIYLTHASDPIVAWTADHAGVARPARPRRAARGWSPGPSSAGGRRRSTSSTPTACPPGTATSTTRRSSPPGRRSSAHRRCRTPRSRPSRRRSAAWSSEAGAHGAGHGIRNRAPGCGVVEPMTTSRSDMAERYERARGLFEHGEYQAAAEALAVLVDESLLEPPLHGTTELRLLLARSYFHSAQLGRAERVTRAVLADVPDDAYANLVLGRTLQRQGRHAEAKPHLAMAELLGGYAGVGSPPA